MEFHQHTQVLVLQCHCMGNQDQKKYLMSLKSKRDLEHTVTEIPESAGQNLPTHIKDICSSVEKQTHFSKIQIASTNLAAKFGLHTAMRFPRVSVYTQTNLKSICLALIVWGF